MGEPVDRPEINVTSPVPGSSATMSRPVPPPNEPAKIGPGLSLSGMIVGLTSLKNPLPRLGSTMRLFEPLSLTTRSSVPLPKKSP